MQYLIILSSALLSGVVSSLMTIYLVKPGRLPKPLKDNPSLAKSEQATGPTSPSNPEPVPEQTYLESETSEFTPVHLSMLSALYSGEISSGTKANFSRWYTRPLNRLYTYLDICLVRIYANIFKLLTPVVVPVARGLYLLERTSIRLTRANMPLPNATKPYSELDTTTTADPGLVNLQNTEMGPKEASLLKLQNPVTLWGKLRSFLTYIFSPKKFKPSENVHTEQKTNLRPLERKMLALAEFGESKITTRSIFAEAALCLVPVACIILAFLFRLHIGSAVSLFTYLVAMAALGAGLLFYAKSPRSFWAIGISIWSATAYYFFNWNVLESVGPATIFITLFLIIYAVSGYIWYGLGLRKHAELEYGLYILHPLIYMAALYLLVVASSPYTVVLVYISIGALYAYFAKEASFKKQSSVFSSVAWFVAVCAASSAIVVAAHGAAEILLLVSLYGLLVYKKHSLSAYAILPAIFFITLRTFELTNSTKNFIFVFNERFTGYIFAIAALTHAYLLTKNQRINFGRLSRSFKRLFAVLAVLLAYFALTLEILDAKVNSQLFPGSSALVVLLGLYLLLAITLYIFGKKHNERSVLALSLILSAYSVYFITTYLL